MNAPLVSILIPAHDAAPWIAGTLASALAQSHPHCEIIVVDDGSRDDTLAIARDLAAGHPGRLRVETQPNAGAAAARNHALRLALGDFIQYLDADDLLSPRKIELQLALLSSRPAGTLATCRWGRFENDPAAARFVDEAVFRDFSPIEYLLQHVSGGHMMHPAAWLVPRAVATAAGPWDESLSLNDDGEYFARIVLAANGIAFCSDPNAASYYRSGIATSLSGRRSPRALDSLQRSVALVSAHILARDGLAGPPPPGVPSEIRPALADYWQRLAYELYPEATSGSRLALLRARDLGGSKLRPAGGGLFRLACQLFGWRAAQRLRRLLHL